MKKSASCCRLWWRCCWQTTFYHAFKLLPKKRNKKNRENNIFAIYSHIITKRQCKVVAAWPRCCWPKISLTEYAAACCAACSICAIVNEEVEAEANDWLLTDKATRTFHWQLVKGISSSYAKKKIGAQKKHNIDSICVCAAICRSIYLSTAIVSLTCCHFVFYSSICPWKSN